MKTRNPIARNSWKVNKPKVIENKKLRRTRQEDKKEIIKMLGFSHISSESNKY